MICTAVVMFFDVAYFLHSLPSTKMVDLPLELWLDIGQYLGDDALNKLLEVNRPLLNIALNLRWRAVTFETRNLEKAMRLLDRLSDPFIGQRLKSLVIIFNEHAGTKPPSWMTVPDPSLASKNIVVRQLLSLHSTILHFRDAAFADFGTKLMAHAQTFTNVTELTIDCWDPLQYDLSSLYESFWRAFGNNLLSLTLMGYLESHASVISSSPTLGQLNHLRIDFGPNVFVNHLVYTNRNHEVLVNTIAPFVNSLNSQLEGLNIRCWAELDISPFFAACNSFPRLRYLAVRVEFSSIWHDTSGLQALLHSSGKKLQRLEMRLNQSRQIHMNTETEVRLGNWLLERLNDVQCMSRVCELDLYPTRTLDGLAIVLASVRRASATLRKLTIRDRYLNQTEVVTIINALSKCKGLRYLRMNVLQLNIDALDLMAAHLPSLQGLSLSVEDRPQSYAFSWDFDRELARRRYDKWKLADLSLFRGRVEVRMEGMRRFKTAIPGIESFFGRGREL